MNELQKGMKASDFRMETDSGRAVSLGDYKNKMLVLYFYLKDDTPGCTSQACTFRDNLPAFAGLNAAILGVSRDDIQQHEKFRDKFALTFPLASDTDGSVCAAYGTWVEKSMYGKKYMGIDRATFLIDGDGIIQRIWRSVKVPGHIDEVRQAVEDLGRKAA